MKVASKAAPLDEGTIKAIPLDEDVACKKSSSSKRGHNPLYSWIGSSWILL